MGAGRGARAALAEFDEGYQQTSSKCRARLGRTLSRLHGLHVTLPPDPSRVVPQHMPSEGWHWAPFNPELEQFLGAPPLHTPPPHLSSPSAVQRFPSSQRDPSASVGPVHTPASQ